ncbi:MAG: hypothetical protein GXO82_00815 [Chlorobi bacterium]|nr:hypothetical protein [Chlorobiota bacterium]
MILHNVFYSFLILLLVGNLSAQDIEAQLSGATNAQGFTVQDNASNSLFTVRGDGKAGLGTGSPVFKLTLEKDGGILARGTEGSGVTLPSIDGPVMIWYPRKAAFRAGMQDAGSWDDAKIGVYSFAGGSGTTASGSNSIAMGYQTTANGDGSTAMGYQTTASGNSSTAMGAVSEASGISSTAMGYFTTASGIYSTSMGRNTIAKGSTSTAMGYNTTASGSVSTSMGSETTASNFASTAIGFKTSASGFASTAIGNQNAASSDNSTAIGYKSTASGSSSVAMGSFATASGANSTAMGNKSTASGKQSVSIGSYISTNGITGSMILGDASTTTLRKAFKENKFYAFFDGGYHLFTNGTGTSYVYLNHNDNAWKTSSDSTKKENYRAADGEDILVKIGRFRLGSWNYKGQDAKRYRHYGPMAQEWFTAFGHDGVGIIGNDTSLSSADVDGIAYIAIQALEKRTAELRATTTDLHKATAELRQTTAELRKKTNDMEIMKKELVALQKKISDMDAMFRKYTVSRGKDASSEALSHVDKRFENNHIISGN